MSVDRQVSIARYWIDLADRYTAQGLHREAAFARSVAADQARVAVHMVESGVSPQSARRIAMWR